ncbi:M14 family metallopeptidase [candidate division KSB1 bacterium]|nr:M14 family metallopeptidase [candidate division KSB1 bacterium]
MRKKTLVGIIPGLALLMVANFLLSTQLFGQASQQGILPPELPWNGKSQALIAAQNNPWITPAEKNGFVKTPRYDETVSWLRKLCEAAPELKMISLGASPEGREIWMVIASKEKTFTPAGLRASGKPVFLAQAGIHSGEIDGKDAGMMLLRDMTVGNKKRDLLEGVNLLFIPIFSVDAHERVSPYNRINQRGPAEMGWRTTARNLNLNRDYAKLDAVEMRALIRALNEWEPDLYFDIHVTDGADYQYDITFGYNGKHGYSPAIANWLDEFLTPAIYRDLQAQGHIPGPLIGGPADGRDFNSGLVDWTAPPRFSNGYGDVRHLPTVLVENHSLKPYKQRVLGTYLLLESTMRVLAMQGSTLQKAIAADRGRRLPEVPLTWRVPRQSSEEKILFLGVEAKQIFSTITHSDYVQWTGKPYQAMIPLLRMSEPAISVKRPKAYWIPPAWHEVIERLARHGIQMERIASPVEIEVEMYRLHEPKLARRPFEGHVNVTGKAVGEKKLRQFTAGAVRIATDQPLGDLAVVLLEPDSPDSFLQWGFFLEIMSATEYVEDYVMQPMAERMLAEDEQLKDAFDQKVQQDSTFAKSPRERLQWFYRQTPFHDSELNLYPVGREL